MTFRGRTAAVLTGIVGLAMALAWSWVPRFWRDELASLRAARLPWNELWPFLRHRDLVHGAYDTMLHPWLAEFGSSHFASRFPSAVAIAFAVAGVTAVGSRVAGLRTGVSSGLVLALLPVTSHYGMETRSYAVACALVTWAGYGLLRASEPGAGKRWWAGYAVLLLAAGVVFVYALLVGLAHTLTLVLGRRSARVQLAILGLVGVVLSPLLILAAGQSGQVSWISRVIVSNVVDTPFSWVVSVPQSRGGFSGRTTLLLHPAAILLGGCLWVLAGRAVIILGRQRRAAGRDVLALAVPWLVLPVTALITASIVRPMFVERYVFFSAPAFALLIGYALAQFGRRALIGCLVILVLLATPLWIADRQPLSKSGLPPAGTRSPASGPFPGPGQDIDSTSLPMPYTESNHGTLRSTRQRRHQSSTRTVPK